MWTLLEDERGRKRDGLHWHLLDHARFSAANRELWDRAVPVSLNEEATRVLPPALQLLQTFSYGIEGNAISAVHGFPMQSPPSHMALHPSPVCKVTPYSGS